MSLLSQTCQWHSVPAKYMYCFSRVLCLRGGIHFGKLGQQQYCDLKYMYFFLGFVSLGHIDKRRKSVSKPFPQTVTSVVIVHEMTEVFQMPCLWLSCCREHLHADRRCQGLNDNNTYSQLNWHVYTWWILLLFGFIKIIHQLIFQKKKEKKKLNQIIIDSYTQKLPDKINSSQFGVVLYNTVKQPKIKSEAWLETCKWRNLKCVFPKVKTVIIWSNQHCDLNMIGKNKNITFLLYSQHTVSADVGISHWPSTSKSEVL